MTSDNSVIQINQKDAKTIVNLLFISGVVFGNPIGDIRESTGSGNLTRNSEQVGNEVGKDIPTQRRCRNSKWKNENRLS